MVRDWWDLAVRPFAQKFLKLLEIAAVGYCILLGPIQSGESVNASPQTYFNPRPFPSHFFAAYTSVATATRTMINPKEYLDILRGERARERDREREMISQRAYLSPCLLTPFDERDHQNTSYIKRFCRDSIELTKECC